MIALIPLLAGIEDLIGVLVFVLFIVISVIGQIAAKWKEQQEKAQRRQAPAPVPRPGQPPRPRAAAGQDPLKDEIGEFLRRAADRRGAAEPAGRPAPPPPQRPLREAQRLRPPKPPIEEPVEVELVEVASSPATSRLPSLRAREAAQVVRQLGRDIDLSDERMSQHIHNVFDHQVGQLTHGQTHVQTHEPHPQTTAAGLAAMIGDPVRMRQAILMNEILQRPTRFWDRF